MPSLNPLRPHGKHHRTIREATQAPIRAQLPAQRVARQGYVYGIPPGGLTEEQANLGASTQTDRKSLLQELYEAYVTCPWAWASVQAIARTITAGGVKTDWVADDEEGDQVIPDKPENVLALERLLAYCNPQQNVRQLLRNFIADLNVFGDAYIEVVWWGALPVALYNQDGPTTTPITDEHGAISGYVQVTDDGKRTPFEPRDIIHVTLDSARPGVTGVSPMQAALGPVTAWLFAAATGKEEFKKGLPPNIHADFPSASQDKDMRTWRDQYASRNVGARNIGAPIITKGGVKLTELQTGKIGDVIQGKDQCRDEILSIFGVPPAQAGVIESGNLGGGTGESQWRSFQVITCQPIDELVMEALNFALTQQAFKITDWMLKFGEVDWRDSTVVEQIRDMRLRNGAYTLNKYRAEIGEPPVEGGDDAVLVDRQNLVLWQDMEAMSKANVASKGAAAVAAGEIPPNDEPLEPGDEPTDSPDDGQGAPSTSAEPDDSNGPPAAGGKGKGKAKPARETVTIDALRAVQVASYQRRLREAMRALPITEASKSTAEQVRDQLGENFPSGKTAWVMDADWEGPVNVPADHIDLSNRESWAASHDGRVPRFRRKLRKKMAEGKHLKPAILVRTPSGDKDIIPDGHHRVLASVDEGQPVWAYVGRVKADTGPWDEMHSSQTTDNDK